MVVIDIIPKWNKTAILLINLLFYFILVITTSTIPTNQSIQINQLNNMRGKVSFEKKILDLYILSVFEKSVIPKIVFIFGNIIFY